MENKNTYRMNAGLKHIKRRKVLLIIPIIFLVMMVMITWKGIMFLRSLENAFAPNFFEWLLVIAMIEVSIIGMMLILTILGTVKGGKKAEKRLLEVDFVDKKGETPCLVSKTKEYNGYIYEFYSPRIPFWEYEKHMGEIETAMNIKIVSVEHGKDMQHVKIKAISVSDDMGEIIRWDNKLFSQEDFVLKLGKGYFGDEEFDLSIVPHAIIGGGSGSGKTKLLQLLLLQCIYKGARVYIADFKGGIDYPKEWHKKCSIIIDAESLSEQLSVILETMEDRRNKFVEVGASNIGEYNRTTGADMRRIIVACDEIAEVLDKTGLEKDEKMFINQIESKISTIARQGRAFGIHLILATQRPDADVIKGQIKNNIGMRICGRADKILSQIILDNSEAAEKISQSDQGMFLTNSNDLFKAYYVDDDCLEGEI